MHGSENRGELQVGQSAFRSPGRFGRWLPGLPPLNSFNPGPAVLGALRGPMQDNLSNADGNNDRIRAGYTFLGQFIDHDLTFDATSSLEQQVDPEAVENFRTPALELDSVYGSGPDLQPYLYNKNQNIGAPADPDQAFLFALNDTVAIDLPRNLRGVAVIGDPRNDENAIISQLHLLFLKFHNKVYKGLTGSSRAKFQEAQRLVRWHYQWIVINEFLPRILGTATTAAIFAGDHRFPGRPFMPVEFSVAAYRFGHSQVRGGYGLKGTASARLFSGNPNGTGLLGFRPLDPTLEIDWQNFFGSPAQTSRRIDTRLVEPLLNLPNPVVPSAPLSLAERNLQRGIALKLPSGQAVAERLAQPIAERLTDAELWGTPAVGCGPAPLWFYILREAEIKGGGQRLAGIGAQLVGRIFQAFLLGDSGSYLVQDPLWTPTLQGNFGQTAGQFTFVDLINFTLGTSIPNEVLATLPGDG
ncbi:MAG: peroxidase family protein [Gemmataceae bacterium]